MVRVRVVAAAAVLVLTGCGLFQGAVTEEDAERWRAAAMEVMPASADVSVEVHESTCTPSNCFTVDVDVTFATFEDLVSHEEALVAVHDLIERDRPDVGPFVKATVHEAEEVEQDVADAIVTATDGHVVSVRAFVGSTHVLVVDRPTKEVRMRSASLMLYVEDVASVTPKVLEQVTSAAHDVLKKIGAPLGAMEFAPLEAWDLDPWGREFDMTVIRVADLDSFAAAASEGCLRQGPWAFDISNDYVRAAPLDAPEGACAPE